MEKETHVTFTDEKQNEPVVPTTVTTLVPPTKRVIYSIHDTPPLCLCILLGTQHFLTAIGGQVTVPLFLKTPLCMDDDFVGLGELIGTSLVVSGIATLLQTTFGVRLPIVQGATFAFLTPTLAMLALPKWECPYIEERKLDPLLMNSSLPAPGSEDHREMWQLRMREIQGAMIVAPVVQVVIGFTGVMGFILRYIGPLAMTPTIGLMGLALFAEAAEKAATHWYIAILTMILMALFSQYMKNIQLPVCTFERKKGCFSQRLPIFNLFPVIMAMILSWVICAILTATNVFTDDHRAWGYYARTDIKSDVLFQSNWFRVPYPGQWGMPTVSTAAVFGMMTGVIAAMIESVGDYFACARLSGAPPPPVHAVNRGIGVEGICCILAGLWGSGNGVTSYSENVGAIGLTKVGSRSVVQVGGVIMLILGCFGKFSALFVTIPDPVIGGVFLVMFGMIAAVGLSNLQYVDLNSSRNIFILGVSLFFGLSFPKWIATHDAIKTGSDIADQILTVLLGTSMFVGGFVGFLLDNTIPGTIEERGIAKWRQQDKESNADMSCYDFPFIQKYLNKIKCCKYVPFCNIAVNADDNHDIEDTYM